MFGEDIERASPAKRDFVTKSEVFEKLKRLAQLHAEGEYSDTEYAQRKNDLIDQLTGTVSPSQSIEKRLRSRSRTKSRDQEIEKESHDSFIASLSKGPGVVTDTATQQRLKSRIVSSYRPHHPRSGSTASSSQSIPKVEDPIHIEEYEDAVKHEFHASECAWTRTRVKVKLSRQLLGRNGERKCFYLKEYRRNHDNLVPLRERSQSSQLSNTIENTYNKRTTQIPVYIPRIGMVTSREKRNLGKVVEAHVYARVWAASYNACDPPKKIDFLSPWLMELVDRANEPVCLVQDFLSGPFRKFSKADGTPIGERNTPQAFSHFTYVSSKKRILICNLQGVGDVYTNPHIIDANGNVKEKEAVDKFIKEHICNSICKYLRLEPLNVKSRNVQEPIEEGRTIVQNPKTVVSNNRVMDLEKLPVLQSPAFLIPTTNKYNCCTIL